jgi:chemotaxis protein CheX
MTMTITIKADQIVQIAGNVWSSFLGMTLREVEATECSADNAGRSVSATVHISGGWNGSVILSCSTPLASAAAAAMFQIAAADLDEDEIADAFGELVNMIGGNLKCLLPEPSQLSLPTVSQGSSHVVTIPGARLLQNVELECDGNRLHIEVWRRREDRRANQPAEIEGTTR